MRSLLLHCKLYKDYIKTLANRPVGIKPEDIKEKHHKKINCIVCLLTIEKDDDNEKNISLLAQEVKKFAEETKRKTVVILPFAHLSKNLGSYDLALEGINLLYEKLGKDFEDIVRSHFGSDKELLLHLYGHKTNPRYREFNFTK